MARQNVNGAFEILVATPGRLIQLLDDGELKLNEVRTLVFDEADQMVDAGFLPNAQRIVADCPKNVQLVLFSATLPGALDQAVKTLFRERPVEVRTKGSQRVVPTLTTINRKVHHGDRHTSLMETLQELPGVSTILFANTHEQCDKIGEWLDLEGIGHVSYRGQMERKLRRQNLALFRNGDVSILLTTDLGGRGLDIERVDRVVNVHLPREVDNYLHRVGRTARAGREGLVVNLVTPRDQPLLSRLENLG
jgi:ATP-dependent RNA helicase RhlE